MGDPPRTCPPCSLYGILQDEGLGSEVQLGAPTHEASHLSHEGSAGRQEHSHHSSSTGPRRLGSALSQGAPGSQMQWGSSPPGPGHGAGEQLGGTGAGGPSGVDPGAGGQPGGVAAGVRLAVSRASQRFKGLLGGKHKPT